MILNGRERAKDCSRAEGGHRRRRRGGWSSVRAERRKACFLRKQKSVRPYAPKQNTREGRQRRPTFIAVIVGRFAATF